MAQGKEWREITSETQTQVVIIADAHVDCEESATVFFQMLEQITPLHTQVIFLGDIFELWIAIPKYENQWQHRFLQWCSQQEIPPLFIEGNHEFFVNISYDGPKFITDGEKISPCGIIVYNQVVFVHGDRFHEQAIGYKSFRFTVRNRIIKSLLAILPWGLKLANRIRLLMKRDKSARGKLPIDMIEKYAQTLLDKTKAKMVVLGHFHHYCQGGNQLVLIPDWKETHKIAIIETDTKKIKVDTWQKIIEYKKIFRKN